MEAFKVMEQKGIDILAIQETKTDKPERTRKYCIHQVPASNKNSTKYWSSGQLLIYQKDLIIVKDTHNSTEHINVFNLMYDEQEVLLKLITVYGQPNKRKSIMNRLIALQNKFLRTEAGVKNVILGDLNLDFESDKGPAQQVMRDLTNLNFK